MSEKAKRIYCTCSIEMQKIGYSKSDGYIYRCPACNRMQHDSNREITAIQQGAKDE